MINRISLEHHIFEYSKKNKHNEDIPVYSVTNTDGFCTEYFSKEVASKDKSTYKIVERGSFAYNPSRINVGSVDWLNCEDKVIVSPLYNVFKTSNEIDNDYLLFFLKSERCNFLIKAKANGSVRDNLKIDTLKQFTIPNISIGEQQRRSGNLKRIRKLIELNQTQLRNYENLIKSRFVEMFGDPITNTRNLETKNLKDVLVLKAGDFTSASDISEEQNETSKYPCYGGNGIRGYVAEYNQEGEYSLVGRQGALSGNVQYACGKFKNTEHALLVTPSIEMNSIWLNQLLLNLDLKRYQTGAAQPGLSVKNLQEIQIIMVPIDEQITFANFVKQVDKSKFDVQKSIDELQTLYDSLMQKYFG